MIQVTDDNSQLRIVRNGVIEFYTYETIYNVSWVKNSLNNYHVLVTFEPDYQVKLELNSIDNQPAWTNDVPGANQAVEDISFWMNEGAVLLNLNPNSRFPSMERVSAYWENIDIIYSFSVSNVGTANGLCLGTTIKPGEIVNFDASSLNNFFKIGNANADGTGTELLITFIY